MATKSRYLDMKKLLLALTIALALTFVPERANAQSPLSFGAQGIYDLDWESFGIGAQVRTGLPIGDLAFVLNPSLEYYFLEEGEGFDQSLFRVNADLLYQIGAANVQVFQPYVGAGLGIQRHSIDLDSDVLNISGSSTDVGLNLLAGASFGIGSPVVPFVQAGLFIGDGSTVGLKAGILFGN